MHGPTLSTGLHYHEVFTPNDIPIHTYVDRPEHKLEEKLRDLYKIPNVVVSVSGPSKTGKTVLIKKVVDEALLITVRGSTVKTPEAIWDRILNSLGKPATFSETDGTVKEIFGGAEGGGKVGIPFLAEGQAKGSVGAKKGWSEGQIKTFHRDGLEQVIKEIAKTDFAIFLDDFHYIESSIRTDVGRQIKTAAESGVKILTASVPHRADDVVRSNPELRGRVVGLKLQPWSVPDLIQIARKGFRALNVDLAPSIEQRCAEEAFGSPQLMQSICLNLALVIDVKQQLRELERIEVSTGEISDALLRTSEFADFSKLLRDLHIGVKTRGTERKEHDLIDGTRGDVYRSILLAMKQDPPKLSFTYEEITTRVRESCVGNAPTGSSVNAALTQMHTISEELQPGDSPLSWDDPTLDVVDPYFLFFLRCSDKLRQIATI